MKLSFAALSVTPVALSVAPSVAIEVAVSAPAGSVVHALVLRARMSLHAGGRALAAAERARLTPLLGEASQLARTTRIPVAWAETSLAVPRFAGRTAIELVVPCTYDLTLATAKLLDGLDGGTVPLGIAFSGTAFFDGGDGALTVQPITAGDATIDLAITTWRTLIEAHHPGGALVTLPRSLVDRLRALGASSRDLDVERTIERLVAAEERA